MERGWSWCKPSYLNKPNEPQYLPVCLCVFECVCDEQSYPQQRSVSFCYPAVSPSIPSLYTDEVQWRHTSPFSSQIRELQRIWAPLWLIMAATVEINPVFNPKSLKNKTVFSSTPAVFPQISPAPAAVCRTTLTELLGNSNSGLWPSTLVC